MKPIIQETESGFLVNGELHRNLVDAIKSLGTGHTYTFIPYSGHKKSYATYVGTRTVAQE